MNSLVPARLPRSVQESPDYNPEWRYLQVLEYLRFRRHQGEDSQPFTVPSSERDRMVRAYFKFRLGLEGAKDAEFRYAEVCQDSNDRVWAGSRIKAMTIAGLSTTEIGRRLHTSPENIGMFQKLYFDVEKYQQDAGALAVIVTPMLSSSACLQQERLWCIAALKLGVKGLDYVMDQRVQLSVSEQNEISDSIHSILAEQSLAYSLSQQLKPEPNRNLLELYERGEEARRRRSDEGDSKFQAYYCGVLNIVDQKIARIEAAASSSPPEEGLR